MPTYLQPRHIPRTEDNKTPLTSIDGFYGPGTWAAWVLAMSSSLIAIRRQDHEGRAAYTLILPILYINWAAVDSLKHGDAIIGSIELTACAVGIMVWGLWYMLIAQYMLKMRAKRQLDFQQFYVHKLILVGFIVPFVSLVISTYRLSALLDVNVNQSGKPTSAWQPLNRSSRFCIWLKYGLLVFIWAVLCLLQVILTFNPAWSRSVRLLRWGTKLTLTVIVIPLCILASFYQLSALFYYERSSSRNAGPFSNCVIMPCAPQSLRESDQGFSLCCGILLFIFEVGSDFIGLVAEKVHFAALSDIKQRWLARLEERVDAAVKRYVRPDRQQTWPIDRYPMSDLREADIVVLSHMA